MAPITSHSSKIPGEFHAPPDPHPYKDDIGVPVIDISSFNTSSIESKREVVQALKEACEAWGFFQLLGHGIPMDLADEMMELAYKFFDQPIQEKLIYSSASVLDDFGFITSFDPASRPKGLRSTWQEFFFQKCSPACDPIKLPENPARLREVSTQYGAKVTALAGVLLELFSQSLGLEPGDLVNRFQGESMSMRVNHYPPCPEPELTIGIQPHSDINAFTILQQDVEGLQVLHEGAWVNLRPISGALVVNIGDQLQILSNDRFKSVEHRGVVNSERSRLSIACFYAPGKNARIGPIPELVTKENPAHFKEIMYGEYAAASLKDLDLERKNALSTLRILRSVCQPYAATRSPREANSKNIK